MPLNVVSITQAQIVVDLMRAAELSGEQVGYVIYPLSENESGVLRLRLCIGRLKHGFS